MLALPVHVHKAGRELSQHGGIDAFAVHLDVAAPVRAQAPRTISSSSASISISRSSSESPLPSVRKTARTLHASSP